MLKNTRVKVLSHKRSRTIFGNADYTPGKTYTVGAGWTGTVTNIFDDGFGGDIIEVKRDNVDFTGQYSPDELEVIN